MIGGVIGAVGSGAAASTEAKAANSATANTKAMFNQVQANEQPYINTGTAATYSLAELYGLPTPSNPNGGQPFNQASINSFTNSPGYQFTKQQGIDTIDAQAAAQNQLLSGNTLKAIADYSSGLASQNFNSYADRLMALGNQGEGAAAHQATASGQAAQSIGNNTIAAGNSTAGGILGSNAALVGGFNTGINNYLQAVGPQSAYGGTSSGLFNGGGGSGFPG
jgi:hypothetical protein